VTVTGKGAGSDIKADGKDTVVFTLEGGNADFAYIASDYHLPIMPAKDDVRIGRPMDVSEYYGREDEREVLELLTKRFLVAIATLAGSPDFQPELAGRFYKPRNGE
jgi:hypothetical protein